MENVRPFPVFLVAAAVLACLASCEGRFSGPAGDGSGDEPEIVGDDAASSGDDPTSPGEDPALPEPDGVVPDGADGTEGTPDLPVEDIPEESGPFCGDGTCNGDETCADCPADCECPPPPPQKQVFFTVPRADGSADTTIEEALGQLLDLAVPGSSVRIALYHFSRTGMADRMVATQARGVDVRIVLDPTNRGSDGVEWQAVTTLKTGLPAGNVTVCREAEGEGACIGAATGINHNKFFLFSQLADGSMNVVVQSSQNLTNPQLHEHNNMIVIRDDAALYASYMGYWTDLQAQARNLDYYHYDDGDTGTRVYYFPRASGDTIVSVLGNVSCAGGTSVRVAMAFFTDGRLAVAEALGGLRDDGCTVQVIIQEDNAGSDVVGALRAHGVDLWLYPRGPNEEGVHSKILLIEGTYSDVAGRKIVWTGSHNYTGPALDENDETLLKVDDADVYDAYLANWQQIQTMAGP
jgi:phosphatidylserine/phosphatidylglycerophosphate/cardiolipin synthase-like enzyme